MVTTHTNFVVVFGRFIEASTVVVYDIRNSFIALVFTNKKCAFVQLVHNIEH